MCMSVEIQHHINFLGLKTAFQAIQSFLKNEKWVSVLIRSDNHTAIAYTDKSEAGNGAYIARQITPENLAGRNYIIVH